MAEPVQYTKLCGRSLYSATKLYTAVDHLLFVEGLFLHQYRRFYFEDLQSITVQESKPGGVIILLSLLATLLFGAGFFSDSMDWMIFCAVMLCFTVPSLILSIIYGKTCRVVFCSAVQRRKIGCLGTKRRIQKYLPVIQQRIAEHQGLLVDEDFKSIVPPPVITRS